MRIKFDYSNAHLAAAKSLSLDAKEIEEALVRGEAEEYAKVEITPRMVHDGYAANSIISSAAFLEAFVNEVFDKLMNEANAWAESGEEWTSRSLGEGILSRMMLGLSDVDPGWFNNKGTLKKYQLLLVYTGREPFMTGRGAYQSASTVQKIRNDLVHFTPDWFDSTEDIGTPGNLPSDLDFNPFYESDRDPESYLSHDIAEWCIESSGEFVIEFLVKMEMDETIFQSGIDRVLSVD